jgi:Mg2+-importing ATPase
MFDLLRRPTASTAQAATRTTAWWALPSSELLAQLASTAQGLSAAEAAARLARVGRNELVAPPSRTILTAISQQLTSPLLLLLVAAAALSFATGETVDAALVTAIVAVSVAIGAVREHRAHKDAAALRAHVQARARVVRDGVVVVVAAAEIVPGDVVELVAGGLVPADARVVAATHLFVNEAVLTGESFAVEKVVDEANEHAGLSERRGCVFMGTLVQSGTGRVVVVDTGDRTAFGAIAHKLTLRPPETEFDRGLRRFGWLLLRVMLVLVVGVLTVNLLLRRPAAETLLFAIALAVGLSPELLPALLSVNLARGATAMAKRGVLVRRLNAIENLGAVDVLCTDKTGTLTEGVVRLQGSFDARGAPSAEVLRLAALNAHLQQGLSNPLDDAILLGFKDGDAPQGAKKVGEIPWDFVRKRVSVAVVSSSGTTLVTKGAVPGVLAACSRFDDGAPITDADRALLLARIDALADDGVRVVAVATRALPTTQEPPALGRDDDVADLTFVGTLTFTDAPRRDAADAIGALQALGVSVKMITGDVAGVARHIARQVGLPCERVLTGRDLDELRDEALWHAAERTDLFVEVDPNQKERVILALKKTGHVTAFLGDGVNDAPAMHAADTSISVDTAVDVAREAADFVLLRPDLAMLCAGVTEGRRIFANTLKYVLTTTSANLGNMVSMAAIGWALPFFPLTAGQILLNNFLSDIPAIGIADDRVDDDQLAHPRRWEPRFIARFMVQFGLLSSVFDGLTFLLLLRGFHADEATFHTAWFIESLLTELVIALVVRTEGPFFRSRPGTFLLWSSVVLVVVTYALPSSPVAGVFGFVPLSAWLASSLAGLTVGYVVAVEVLKRWFYRRR